MHHYVIQFSMHMLFILPCTVLVHGSTRNHNSLPIRYCIIQPSTDLPLLFSPFGKISHCYAIATAFQLLLVSHYAQYTCHSFIISHHATQFYMHLLFILPPIIISYPSSPVVQMWPSSLYDPVISHLLVALLSAH